jgi:hypothetical protein
MIANDPCDEACVVAMADKIAPSEATVLITGESGTGKEVMSQYIHRKSKRGAGSFIAVNCAAIPESFWNPNYSVMKKGHLPVLSVAVLENSKRPMAELSCLMKSLRCTLYCRPNFPRNSRT